VETAKLLPDLLVSVITAPDLEQIFHILLLVELTDLLKAHHLLLQEYSRQEAVGSQLDIVVELLSLLFEVVQEVQRIAETES
jgi:hypothetical protein